MLIAIYCVLLWKTKSISFQSLFYFLLREKRHLNIDMRIGVHSGDVLSGVIGAAKWQFDIWSKDVDIANRLEATGATGRVHVSQKTLSLLDGEYFFEDGTEKAREDPVLQKHGIRTFLIKSLRVSIPRTALRSLPAPLSRTESCRPPCMTRVAG